MKRPQAHLLGCWLALSLLHQEGLHARETKKMKKKNITDTETHLAGHFDTTLIKLMDKRHYLQGISR